MCGILGGKEITTIGLYLSTPADTLQHSWDETGSSAEAFFGF